MRGVSGLLGLLVRGCPSRTARTCLPTWSAEQHSRIAIAGRQRDQSFANHCRTQSIEPGDRRNLPSPAFMFPEKVACTQTRRRLRIPAWNHVLDYFRHLIEMGQRHAGPLKHAFHE